MERYIGMDVHAASCTLAVISEKGRRLRDFPVETNGQALVEAVRMIPGHKHLVFEEGLQSAWLYETLNPHVDEIVVAGVTESRGPKSDKRDAYGLAEKLRVANLDKVVFKVTASIHSPARTLADSHHAGRRLRTSESSDQESVSLTRHLCLRRRTFMVSVTERTGRSSCVPARRRERQRLYDHLDFSAGTEGAGRGRSAPERERSTPSSGSWRLRQASGRFAQHDCYRLLLHLTDSERSGSSGVTAALES